MLKVKILFLTLLTSLLYAQPLPLVFSGNKNLSDQELYKALEIDTPAFYEFWKDSPKIGLKNSKDLVATIKEYYKFKGFFQTTAKSLQNDNKIIIEIIENEPIRISDITTVSKLDIQNQIPFKIGDIFESDKFTQSKKDIEILYGDNHYCKIDSHSKAWLDTQTNKAYISYDITPNEQCVIGQIRIFSSKTIEPKFVESLLYFKEGTLFSSQLIKDSYDSLYANGGISKAIISTHIDDNSNKVNIDVKVSEIEKPTRLETGLGYSSDEGPMVSLGIKNKNIFGNLKTIGINSRLTQSKQNIQIEFNQPLSNKNYFGANGGYENEDFQGYSERRFFSNIYLNQRKTSNRFTQSIVLDNSKTYNSTDLNLFPEGGIFLLSPKLRWEHDKRDNILSPKKGYFFNTEIMGSFNSFLSDASYYKIKLKGGYIFPLDKSILALQASFGSLKIYDGEIPASYRFYAGGVNSNRAYSYQTLGPKNSSGDPIGFNSILETTIEYRFPIYQNFRGVIFNDNTFVADGDIPKYSNGYHSLGLGIRYTTPVGPLALDIGFDVDQPQKNYAIQFRIGEVF
jgi:translocation and assembly module TamA